VDQKVICPSCGTVLQPGIKHCTECGAKIETSAEETVVEAAAEAAAKVDEAAAKAEGAATEAETVFGAPFAQQPPSAFLNDTAAAVSTEPVSQEKPEPAYHSQTAAPVYPAAAPAYAAAAAAAPAASAAAHAVQTPQAYPAPAAVPAEDPDKPGRKSKYAPMTSVGMAVEIFLMSIPVVGFVLMILWSCGVCRKIARRNLARAYLILLIVGIIVLVVLALLGRFVFSDELTRLVEQVLPGYTIQWN